MSLSKLYQVSILVLKTCRTSVECRFLGAGLRMGWGVGGEVGGRMGRVGGRGEVGSF